MLYCSDLALLPLLVLFPHNLVPQALLLLLLLFASLLLQRLLRATQALGVFSSSAAAAALSRLGAPPTRVSMGAPLPCTVPPQAAEAAALQAAAAAAAAAAQQQGKPYDQQRQQQQQEQQQQLLRRCIRAYRQCLSDAEAGEAAAATAPPSFEARDQSALLLLQCLVQQQALDRASLLRLLPGLLLQLQQQQQQQRYLQSCGLVLTALASCEVHLLHVWGSVLAPLLQPGAASQLQAAAAASPGGCAAATAKPWGSWLLSRPLLQHVEASLAAALLCSAAAAGGSEEQQRGELLRAAVAAADHAAAASEGFLRLLQHSSSSGSSSSSASALTQLTDEAFGELAKNVCGFVRLHGAAQRLLHCMQQPHLQLQQQLHMLREQQNQQQQAAAADTPEKSHPLRELLRVHLPEVHLRDQEQQQQQQHHHHHHHQQGQRRGVVEEEQQIVGEHGELLFDLLLECARRGSPSPKEELPLALLLLLEDTQNGALPNLDVTCAQPLLRSFLLAASRGAAKCSKGLQTTPAATADPAAPFVSSSSAVVCAGVACVPESLQMVLFEEEETPGSPLVLQLLLQRLLQLPAAECMQRFAAAAAHFGQHVGASMHAASLQQRRPRLLSHSG
ncbi:hypothetical protein Esti_006003 [Eimeria stiedai]